MFGLSIRKVRFKKTTGKLATVKRFECCSFVLFYFVSLALKSL